MESCESYERTCRSVLFFCHFEVELIRGGMLQKAVSK